jgi:hypothetical protein
MDCSCNCFGVATAARVPVKRYNLLVPDVFPVVEPPFDKPLGISIERKMKKLGEYLEKNEFRAPKVRGAGRGRAAALHLECTSLRATDQQSPASCCPLAHDFACVCFCMTWLTRSRPRQVSRRLQRRLHKELGAGRYGYVKLAAETYAHLLAQGKPEKSNLLAYELVVGTVVKRRRFVGVVVVVGGVNVRLLGGGLWRPLGPAGVIATCLHACCCLFCRCHTQCCNLMHPHPTPRILSRIVPRFVVAGPRAPLSFREPHLGSAVGLLLSHPDPQLRKLGVDLLTRFLQCQVRMRGWGCGGHIALCWGFDPLP